MLLPGNHDRVDALRAAFRRRSPRQDGRADGVVEGEVRIVTLDSSRFPEPGGDLDADQLDWLEDVLSAAPTAPTIVALHHPPFATGIGHMDAMALSAAASADLEAVIARHPQVERVVCGHLHRSVIRRFGGTIAQVCPARPMRCSSTWPIGLQRGTTSRRRCSCTDGTPKRASSPTSRSSAITIPSPSATEWRG